MKKILTSLAAIATLFLASCAINVSPEDEALAKTFTPGPGRSNVYIYRPVYVGLGILGGNARPVNLELDGKPAILAPEPNQFCMLDIPPGEHTISTKPGLFAANSISPHKFTANKGENVFLKMTPLFMVNAIVASTPQVSWKRLSNTEGRDKIANSKLSSDIEVMN